MSSLISALPHVFLPLTVIIAVTSITGFLGNALAFYVFHFCFSNSGFNKLMATLAVYDMLACAIHMPLDIATFFPIGSARSYLCKITCFQLAFTSTGSALVLLAIAVVRFYGIHKPFLGLFSTKSAVYVIFVSVLMSSGIGLPITFLFGSGTLEMDGNSTAEICAVDGRFSESVGPIIYYLVLAGLYMITLFFHTFLYVKSVMTVWNRRKLFVSVKGNKNAIVMTPKFNRSHIPSSSVTISSRVNSVTATATTNTNNLHRPVCRNYPGNTRNPLSTIYQDNTSGQISTAGRSAHLLTAATNRNTSETGANDDTRSKNKKKGNNKSRTNQCSTSSEMTSYSNASTLPVRGGGAASNVNQTSYRVLAVVISISIAYFLSYAPHFGVMFYLFTHDEDVFTESAQSLVFELLLRSFFLNTVLDPTIYGLLSSDFRREARKALKKMFFMCSSCRQ